MEENEQQQNKKMWEDRYGKPEYAYGKEPNVFFKEQLSRFKPRRILMPADGEGRNGVFAAKIGWQVTSFDLSSEGRAKALELAKEQNVSIDYLQGTLAELRLQKESYDAIGLIYAHFPAREKSRIHRELLAYLKPGGVIILEAFCKQHLRYNSLNPKVGGPTSMEMLFSKEEIEVDFNGYEILLLQEQEIELDEGLYHIGKGAVVRFIGIKTS